MKMFDSKWINFHTVSLHRDTASAESSFPFPWRSEGYRNTVGNDQPNIQQARYFYPPTATESKHKLIN